MPYSPTAMVVDFARAILDAGCERKREYAAACAFLRGRSSVLDVACGTGTFLRQFGPGAIGIDINPENVEFCLQQGLDARVGSALQLPFQDRAFEAVHCSHLMQVFNPDQAVTLIRELARVTVPGGRIVLTTLSDFRRFFRHPENVRPYPPDAIRRLFGKQRGAQSPMFQAMPTLIERSIWLRHPALLELNFSSSARLARIGAVLAAGQRVVGLRKFWQFDAFVMCLERQG